jgi:16S rRNA (guanine(1405)-N(7))-methyltransferase
MHDDLEKVVTAVKNSAKYGATSEETIRDLAVAALQQHKKPKAAIKAVRTRLHSIMAPYLGDPIYDAAAAQLSAAFATGDLAKIKTTCAEIMAAHLSTQERLPLLNSFYQEIFALTGPPRSLMDIACGLNPLAFPWMGLDVPIPFYAYDIHEPRIHFLNHYFRLQGLPPLAQVQDVALRPPQESVDVALFLKEMPRFARNYAGQAQPLLHAIPARFLVLSYPRISTHGGRDLTGRYREFMAELLADTGWPRQELRFPGELVFVIEKGMG